MVHVQTTTRSFRLSQSTIKALQEEAKRKNVSVNTLLNQLLLSYADYDRYLKRFQLVKITGTTMRRVLDATTEDTISTAGRHAGEESAPPIIMAKVGELSKESVIDFLRDTGDYTDLYEYSEVLRGEKGIITLSHQLGYKGSLFLAAYVEALFSKVNVHVKPQVTSHSVVVEF